MKKGVIFLAVSVIIVIFAILSVLLKSINSMKVSAKTDIEESNALAEIDSFDFEKLKEKIEGSSYITYIVSLSGNLKVDYLGNVLNVSIIKEGLKYSNTFTFSDNVLSAKVFNIKKMDDITYHIFDLAYSIKYINLNDIISSYVQNADINSYNLENSGLQIINDEISMKTDRRLNLIDFNNQYITKELVEKNSSKLNSEKLINFGNDNIKVVKTGTKGFMIISISEKNKITENTYKSLINILGVVLEYNKVYETFLNSHIDMKFKDEKTSDYILEINPEKEEYEKLYFEDEPMIRVTLYGK